MQSALNILATTKDTNILQAAKHVFNPATRSPQMVGTLRRAIEGKNPAAWQGLKRMYLDDVATDALKSTELGEVANPAGKIAKAFYNPKIQANIRVAMSPDEYTDFREMLSVFRKAASVPALRSDTEFNRLMSEKATKEAAPVAAKVAGAVQTLNPANKNFLGLEALKDFLTERNLDRNAEKVAKLITSGDPDAIHRMRELRRLSLASREGLLAFGHFLARAGVGAAEAVLDPDN
jgi:hypothetical protein